MQIDVMLGRGYTCKGENVDFCLGPCMSHCVPYNRGGGWVCGWYIDMLGLRQIGGRVAGIHKADG